MNTKPKAYSRGQQLVPIHVKLTSLSVIKLDRYRERLSDESGHSSVSRSFALNHLIASFQITK
ncbi:hypothetical protein R50072_13480 [Simiduia litorea]